MCVIVPNFLQIAQAVAEIWRFRIFLKMAAVRHLGFLKVGNFNCPLPSSANMRHHAKFCARRSRRCGDMAVFRFFKMAAVRHLGFVIRLFGPPTKCRAYFGGLCHCAKFGLNRWSSFDNMQVLIF